MIDDRRKHEGEPPALRDAAAWPDTSGGARTTPAPSEGLREALNEAEPYENTLSLDELRREVRRMWDQSRALNDDLCELPEVPSVETMRALSSAAMNIRKPDLWEIGKAMQRRGLEVPSKTEYECAAGLWSIIRAALLDARQALAATDPRVEGGGDDVEEDAWLDSAIRTQLNPESKDKGNG